MVPTSPQQIRWPALGPDGNPRWPANDTEAQAAGLVKVEMTDTSIRYAYPPDATEIVAAGVGSVVAYA